MPLPNHFLYPAILVFLQRPIDATMPVRSAAAMALVLRPSLCKKREEAFKE